MLKALKTNRLVHSPQYGKILLQYNEVLKRDGKVNNKRFWEDVVRKELPNYSMESWYYFLKRFRTEAGIVAVEQVVTAPKPLQGGLSAGAAEEVEKTLMSNQLATTTAISRALNIGAARLKDMMDNPQLMSSKDAIDLVFKAMKAQDSRIHAIGKVREDGREEEKLNRAFSEGAYQE